MVLNGMPELIMYTKPMVTLVSAVDLTVIMNSGFVSVRWFCAEKC